MNLEQTWENCVTLWRRVVERRRTVNLEQTWENCVVTCRGTEKDRVSTLKSQTLSEMGYNPANVLAYCFFCVYDEEHRTDPRTRCSTCPGRLVDPEFNCVHLDYCWSDYPEAFLEKIEELWEIFKETSDDRA